MKTKIAVALVALALVGCARFSTKQSDLSFDELGKPQRQVTTRASAWTFASANSKLATWKASQTDKTQGATVGGLEQASTGTNISATIQATADLLRAVGSLAAPK